MSAVYRTRDHHRPAALACMSVRAAGVEQRRGMMFSRRASASVAEPRAVLDAEADFLGAQLDRKKRARDLGAGEARAFQIALAKIDPAQVRVAEVGVAEVHAARVELA